MSAPALLLDGPREAAWLVVLAHGAGQPMDSDFMAAFATGLARRGAAFGGLRVARFEFPYMRRARREGRRRPPDREPVLVEAWHGALAAARRLGYPARRTVIGGKSLGGRIASLVADPAGVAGLVCLGYPFHPPGRPMRLRTAHLEHLRTPALVCQGTRDPFGSAGEVAGYRLSAALKLCWLEDGDHGFRPRRGSGRSGAQNLEAAVEAVAGFVAALAGTDP